MNRLERILAIREGGQTQRCHTMPHHLGPYNVAVHSYNALNLLLLLWPENELPSFNLVQAVLWHDIAERWTGDTPAPTKWASPELKALLDNLEQLVLDKLGIGEVFKQLTREEAHWLTGVDLLELFIWAYEQSHFGNLAAGTMIERILALFEQKQNIIPAPIKEFLKEFKWQRSIECDELLGS